MVALARHRWRILLAIGCATVGALVAVLPLVHWPQLANSPIGSDAAPRQASLAALVITLVCVLTGAAWSALSSSRLVSWHPPARLTRGAFPRFAAALVLLALVAAVLAAHPVRRFESFKQSPADIVTRNDFAREHLISGNSSGRWQFWTAAAHEWTAHPVVGGGAGSYASWWAQHGSFSYFVTDAHSLYLQALAELGGIGLLLIVGVIGGGLVIGVRRVLLARPDERNTIAALVGVLAAFVVGAGIDWMWQLTAVTVVGVLCLGLLVGAATAPAPIGLAGASPPWPRVRSRFSFGVVAVVVCWIAICAQGVPLLAQLKIADSQAAARRGETEAAVRAAADARDIQPWAASPYLQLALVAEQAGQLRPAHTWIQKAIDRDGRNWRLWLIAARLEVKLGDVRQAAESLRRAAALDPRSALFRAIRGK
jgi:hypothetical protein